MDDKEKYNNLVFESNTDSKAKIDSVLKKSNLENQMRNMDSHRNYTRGGLDNNKLPEKEELNDNTSTSSNNVNSTNEALSSDSGLSTQKNDINNPTNSAASQQAQPYNSNKNSNKISHNSNNNRPPNSLNNRKNNNSSGNSNIARSMLSNMDKNKNSSMKQKLESAATTAISMKSPLIGRALSKSLDKRDEKKQKDEIDNRHDDGKENFKIPPIVIKVLKISFVPVSMIFVFMILLVSSSQVFLAANTLGQADNISDADAESNIEKIKDDEEKIDKDIDEENDNSNDDDNSSSGNSSDHTVSKTGKEKADKIIANALKQEGNGPRKYIDWYYGSGAGVVDWCAIFVNWLFNNDGDSKLYASHSESSAIAGEDIKTAMAHGYGKWYESEYTDSSTTPKAGDVVVFNWVSSESEWGYDSNGNPKKWKYQTPQGSDHVGFVYKVDSQYIYTVEGNANSNSASSATVTTKQWDRKNIKVNGYYRPNY